MILELSTAMELGHTLKTFDSDRWLSDDGSCGCAFSGALLAIGKWKEFLAELPRKSIASFGDPLETAVVKQEWPWLTFDHLMKISVMAHAVERGEIPVENIWAYVRSVEPKSDVSPVILEAVERVGVA